VKIIYANGTVTEALLLSREGDTLRAAVPGEDDIRELTRTERGWITQEWEPVTIEFEWQRNLAAEVPNETDCICSKELADRLKAKLLGVPAEDEEPGPQLYVFSADGRRVKIRCDHLTVQ
jgi:hypothetical protein